MTLDIYLNMWWIRLFVVLLTYLTGYLNINNIRIWKLSTSTRSHGHSHARQSHLPLNKKLTIQYDPTALKEMELAVQHDQRLHILPFGAIRIIRSLGLNVKPRSRCKDNRSGFIQYGVNRSKLVMIKRERRHDPNIILSMVNVQSLKTKELQISELFEDHALDILIMMETWLTNKEND